MVANAADIVRDSPVYAPLNRESFALSANMDLWVRVATARNRSGLCRRPRLAACRGPNIPIKSIWSIDFLPPLDAGLLALGVGHKPGLNWSFAEATKFLG